MLGFVSRSAIRAENYIWARTSAVIFSVLLFRICMAFIRFRRPIADQGASGSACSVVDPEPVGAGTFLKDPDPE